MNLSSNTKLIKVADHTAAGTSPVTSSEVDMKGWGGVMFFTSFGTAAANNVLKAQQDTVTGMGSAADLEGTQVATGASPTNEDVWLDIYHPQERFLRVIATPGTSSTVESIWALLYEPLVATTDYSVTSGTITGELHVEPSEGTA